MCENKKVSVIMGIYNCANTLPEAIDSILAQTYTNWELIMCDDASTDSTYEVAKSYSEKYPDKIILLKNEKNSKLAFTLNQCLEYATGFYVARMDADDQSIPERFEKQVKFLAEHSEFDLVATGIKLFDGREFYGERMSKKEIPQKEDLARGPCFAHATIMTYKRVYDELGGYYVSKRTERGQDYDLWFRFFQKGFKGYNLQECLYIGREGKDFFSRKKRKYRIHAFLTMRNGFKIVGMNKKYYIFMLSPLIKCLIPGFLMNKIKVIIKKEEYKNII